MSDSLVTRTLRKLNYGIYIVTSRKPGSELTSRSSDWVSASTISWASQLTMDSNLLGISVQKNSNLAETIGRSKNFALHILSEEDRGMVKEFDGPVDFSDDQVNGYKFKAGESGAPLLNAGIGYIECKLVDTVNLDGDHMLFIGYPVEANLLKPKARAIAIEETEFEYGG